jgi:FkbM family methyltransferase
MREVLKAAALRVPPIRRMHQDRLRLYGQVAELAAEVDRLRERLWVEHSPFFHYRSAFDAEAVIRRHAAPDLAATPGYVTNFLGVLVDPRVLEDVLAERAGTVEDLPIPANWHADIAEWAAALRAVELAGATFRMIELGCGWGCWMVNTGVAARRAGKPARLCGVEGDAAHVELARETLARNGFGGDDVRLVHGIAAAAAGRALMPRAAAGGAVWDREPVLGPSEEQLRDAGQSGGFDVLDVVGLDQLIGGADPVDLLHVDIQGGEAELVAACRQTLARRVRYLVIGTHGRAIEGRLVEVLAADGWRLEMERPAIVALDGDEPRTVVDGVQGWRNPAV